MKSKVLQAIGLLALVVMLNGCAFVFGPKLQETRHIVRRGDTLPKISTMYYGSANKVELILRANPWLDAGEPLEPGRRLNVPVEMRQLKN